MTIHRVLPLSCLLLLLFGPGPAGAGTSYRGERQCGCRSQVLVLNLDGTGTAQKATLDLPEFGAEGIPATRFDLEAGRVHFELMGDEETAVFDGRLSHREIQGTWREGTRGGPFHLRQAHTPTRPREEELDFNDHGIRLAGTLVRPSGKGPSPAVVFVHGAGPEARDPSRFLARFLAGRGVAALIYDKRGVGGSEGDWRHASFEELASDAAAAVQALRTRPDIDPARIGLLGTSQGGWVAPMAAARITGLRFLVLKSAPGVTPEAQELARVGMAFSEPADQAAAQDLYRRVIAFARTGKDWDALAQALAAAKGKSWNVVGDLKPDAWILDFIRKNYDQDPVPVYRGLRVPILFLYGGQDRDVPVQASLSHLLPVLERPGVTVHLFMGAGHDLRENPGEGEGWDFPRFAPGYLDLLAAWIARQCQGGTARTDSRVSGTPQ